MRYVFVCILSEPQLEGTHESQDGTNIHSNGDLVMEKGDDWKPESHTVRMGSYEMSPTPFEYTDESNLTVPPQHVEGNCLMAKPRMGSVNPQLVTPDSYDMELITTSQRQINAEKSMGGSKHVGVLNSDGINCETREWKPRTKKHHCPYCDYSSDKSTNVRDHTRQHTGEKPFECDL